MSAGQGASVEIVEMALRIRMFTVSEATRLAHERTLLHATSNMPIQRTMVSLINIPSGTRSEHRENLVRLSYYGKND